MTGERWRPPPWCGSAPHGCGAPTTAPGEKVHRNRSAELRVVPRIRAGESRRKALDLIELDRVPALTSIGAKP